MTQQHSVHAGFRIGYLFEFFSSFMISPHNRYTGRISSEKERKKYRKYAKFELLHVIQVPMVTTESGLQYKDIKVGEGPSPPVGFQVAAHVVMMFSHVFLLFLLAICSQIISLLAM